MAGFDAMFKFKPYDRELVVACVAAMRRRARRFEIRMRATVRRGAAYVEINGNTYQVDIFIERLRRDLPTIAEAIPSSRTPEGRRKTAAGLVEILTRYRFSAYDYAAHDWLPTLRARSKPVQGYIHEIYPNDTSGLEERMFVTMDLLASWHFDEVPAPVLIEEVHTASELLLKASVAGRTSRLTYAQLVGTALTEGVFDFYDIHANNAHNPVYADQAEAWKAREQADAQLLMSLKDERRQVKHDGSGDAEGWLRLNFWSVVRVLEGLATKARNRPDGAV